MKIYLEEKEYEIDGNKGKYNSFYVKLNCGVLGDYNVNLKLESKTEKSILAQALNFASFEIIAKQTKEGNTYVSPVIKVDVPGGLQVDIKPVISADTLMLIRLASTL